MHTSTRHRADLPSASQSGILRLISPRPLPAHANSATGVGLNRDPHGHRRLGRARPGMLEIPVTLDVLIFHMAFPASAGRWERV